MRMRYRPARDSVLYKPCITDLIAEQIRQRTGWESPLRKLPDYMTVAQQSAIYYGPDAAMAWSGDRRPQNPEIGEVYMNSRGQKFMYDGHGWLQHDFRIGAPQWTYAGPAIDINYTPSSTAPHNLSDPELPPLPPKSSVVSDFFESLRKRRT